MSTQRVVIKGVRDDIFVILDADAAIPELMAGLTEQTRLGRDFFAGRTAYIDVRGGELTQEAESAVTRYLMAEMGFVDVKKGAVPMRSEVAASPPSEGQEVKSDDSHSLGTQAADETLLVRRTLRSGQKVNHLGNVVIMGDVNPGAEIVAGGDIIVLGSLRGVAHAGATGTETASVFALKLQPTQLRIANYIARPPDGDKRVPTEPEVANIKDGRLVIEAYNLSNRF